MKRRRGSGASVYLPKASRACRLKCMKIAFSFFARRVAAVVVVIVVIAGDDELGGLGYSLFRFFAGVAAVAFVVLVVVVVVAANDEHG